MAELIRDYVAFLMNLSEIEQESFPVIEDKEGIFQCGVLPLAPPGSDPGLEKKVFDTFCLLSPVMQKVMKILLYKMVPPQQTLSQKESFLALLMRKVGRKEWNSSCFASSNVDGK